MCVIINPKFIVYNLHNRITIVVNYCSIFSNQNILAIKQIAVNVIQYSSSAIIWEITLSIETLST